MSIARLSCPGSSSAALRAKSPSSTKKPAPRRGSTSPWATSISNATTTVFLAYRCSCESPRKDGSWSPGRYTPSAICWPISLARLSAMGAARGRLPGLLASSMRCFPLESGPELVQCNGTVCPNCTSQ
ncbi:hypothetical protein G6F59_017890 [Rhizopus arrhizus]|nr:hypothetical protein G6F59_017890 [Rhizopus arrhizus]